MLDYIEIHGAHLISSRIALGTWAMGGWMWGGTDDKESIRTIHAALDQGINLIDTAPIYGYGRSEEIVGEALRQRGRREAKSNATLRANAFSKNSRTRCADSTRITSISIRCTGLIPLCPLRRQQPRCENSTNKAKFARSV